jgi:hypothetical protein
MIGQAFHWANLALAFLLELCALGALGYWGVRTGDGLVAKVALGLGAPFCAAVLWGLFAAPRAPCRSSGSWWNWRCLGRPQWPCSPPTIASSRSPSSFLL